MVLLSHAVNLLRHLSNLTIRPLNRRPAVTLPMPSLDITVHFVQTSLLLLRVVTEFANVAFSPRVVDELEAARLAHAVLLVALLTEMAPAPVATAPKRHFKVAHLALVFRE